MTNGNAPNPSMGARSLPVAKNNSRRFCVSVMAWTTLQNIRIVGSSFA
jgi:hypothetical protein